MHGDDVVEHCLHCSNYNTITLLAPCTFALIPHTHEPTPSSHTRADHERREAFTTLTIIVALPGC